MSIFRRMLLALVACLVCAGVTAQTAGGSANRPETIDLWPGTPPGGGGPSGAERIGQSGTGVGAVSNISQPRIEVYHPARPDGTAVLIIGGGGYFRIGIGHESLPTAQWLAALGITPVVLYYRLPADGWKPVAPFQDGQRAMRIVRAHARDWGLDPHRIGILGFSAGGNLAGMIATRFAHDFYAPVDSFDKQSARPDFAGLIYPVTSLQPPYDTTRTVRELAVQSDAATAYTVQLHVADDTPPTFIAHAADDPIVNVGASVAMFEALHKQHVPVELHVFEKGGHGWGLGQPGSLVAAWPRLFAAWIRVHGFFPTAGTASPASPPSLRQAALSSDDGDDSDN